MPKRIQRKRSKGWRMPAGAVLTRRDMREWKKLWRRVRPTMEGPDWVERNHAMPMYC